MEKEKVTLEEFNEAIDNAKDNSNSFEFTDIDGNTQTVDLSESTEFVSKVNEEVKKSDKPFSDKTLATISDISGMVNKRVSGVITAVSKASKELVAQKKVIGQGFVIGFMVATGIASIGKSDLAPENTFGGRLLKEIGYEMDFVPVANDVTDYVAGSINRALKHYQDSKGTNEFSRIVGFNENKEQQNDDVYGMTQDQLDALNIVYGDNTKEEIQNMLNDQSKSNETIELTDKQKADIQKTQEAYQEMYNKQVAGEEVPTNSEIRDKIVEYANKDSEAILNEQLQFTGAQKEQIQSFEQNLEEYKEESGRSR